MGAGDLCDKCRYMREAEWTPFDASGLTWQSLRDFSRGRSYCISTPEAGKYHRSPFRNEPLQVDEVFASELFVHHTKVTLREQAASGCHLCTLILDSEREMISKKTEMWNFMYHEDFICSPILYAPNDEMKEITALDFLVIREGSMNLSEINTYLLTMFGLHPTTGKHKISQECSSEANISTFFLNTETQSLPVEHTFQPNSSLVKRIQRWREACVTEHVVCQQYSKVAIGDGVSIRPTRLIKISNSAGGLDVRLCNSADLAHTPDYVTLSHRWADGVPLRLLKENVAELYARFSFASLPHLFKEVIQYVFALGQRYLWIDALCIIQDSHKDWMVEYKKMAAVYSGAYLNIAATAAPDCHGGLFNQMSNSLLATPLIFETAWKGTDISQTVWTVQSIHNWFTNVENAELNTRAWVLQEYLLAPRTIQFAADQVWWTCKHTRSCEGLLEELPPLPVQGVQRLFTQYSWRDILEVYSKLSLTFPDDRLPGIAGIATIYQKQHGHKSEDYIAGLWRGNLPLELMWEATTPSPKVDRAPTWSWASQDGAVSWPLDTQEFDYSLFACKIDVRLDAESLLNPLDARIKASLFMTCAIHPIIIAGQEDGKSMHVVTSSGGMPVSFPVIAEERVSKLMASIRKGAHKLARTEAKLADKPNFCFFKPDEVKDVEEWRSLTTAFLPFSFSMWHGEGVLSDSVNVLGLVVEPVEGHHATWRRVGFLEILYLKRAHAIKDVAALWRKGGKLPKGMFMKAHKNRTYDIMII